MKRSKELSKDVIDYAVISKVVDIEWCNGRMRDLLAAIRLCR